MTDVNHAEELRALRLRAEAAEKSRDEWRAEHDRVQKQRNDARLKETDAQRKAHAANERANRNAGLLDEARAEASRLLERQRQARERLDALRGVLDSGDLPMGEGAASTLRAYVDDLATMLEPKP